MRQTEITQVVECFCCLIARKINCIYTWKERLCFLLLNVSQDCNCFHLDLATNVTFLFIGIVNWHLSNLLPPSNPKHQIKIQNQVQRSDFKEVWMLQRWNTQQLYCFITHWVDAFLCYLQHWTTFLFFSPNMRSLLRFWCSVFIWAAVLLGLRQVGDGKPQDGSHSAQLSQFWGDRHGQLKKVTVHRQIFRLILFLSTEV